MNVMQERPRSLTGAAPSWGAGYGFAMAYRTSSTMRLGVSAASAVSWSSCCFISVLSACSVATAVDSWSSLTTALCDAMRMSRMSVQA
jgi:hypothetical protein